MSQKDEQFWKMKLMAFLHDPPSKCFDIRQHEKVAESARIPAGISEDDYKEFTENKTADWIASAADRFPFPARKCTAQFTGGDDSPFKHPMGGSSISFPNPIPSAEYAEEKFKEAIGGTVMATDDWHDKFFLYWRRWAAESACLDDRLAYLPADTRMPDHTIWNHMSLCSALQSCVGNKKNEIDASFLIFQLSPVQDFIAQAKLTRDLWSGSYLLSWLTAHAIKAVTDEFGPDCIIFPSLCGQPIYDLLHKDLYESINYGDENLWDRMYKKDHKGNPAINEGMRKLLTPTIPNRFCAILPTKNATDIARAAENAIKVELDRIGNVIYKHLEGKKKEGVSTDIDRQRWNKQLELFPQITWTVTPWKEHQKLELGEQLKELGKLALETIPKEDRDDRNYKNDNLNTGFYWGANFANANKQSAARRNTRDFEQFITDSEQDGSPKDPLSGKEEIVGATGYSAIMNIKRHFATEYLKEKIGFTDGQFKYAVRFESTQDLAKKNKKTNNRYIAVLAMDGDNMGKWLSGEKTPKFIDQLAGKAVDYFNELENFNKDMQCSVSPAYHLQFSEALSNFALHLAERVVYHFNGQLIYAGGDDVLAMLPASRALECAEVLRACFRGKDIPKDLENGLELAVVHDGFVNADAGYPLMVPGVNADVSCGIAVGHESYPLQALVREAQIAEKRAKNQYNRSAFAISLIKRGGETINWGGNWNDSSLPLYKEFSKLSEDEILSGRFPYALAGLLKPYQLDAKDDDGKPLVAGDFKAVIEREFEHVLKQQCQKSMPNKTGFLDMAKTYLDELFVKGRPEDFTKLFLTSTFMNRQRGE